MRIYLIGFMGCGKTSFAKRLARKVGYKFLDMDDMLEKEYRISISDLFAKYDESVFRKLEQEILYKTFTMDNTVISTGGGTPCYEDNMEKINENGVSVYLKMDPKMLHDRLTDSPKPRPLIQKVPVEERLQHIVNMLKKREKFYLQANYTVNGKDADVDQLFKLLAIG